MANNILTGGNFKTALKTETFANMGITALNTHAVYEAHNGVFTSFVPGAPGNSITGVTAGRGYFFDTITPMDLTFWLAGPLPAAPTALSVAAGAPQNISFAMGDDYANATLTATATTDPAATITGYLWELLSGPAQYSDPGVATPAAASTILYGLRTGTYVYKITVTDSLGRTAFFYKVLICRPNAPKVEIAVRSKTKLWNNSGNTYTVGYALTSGVNNIVGEAGYAATRPNGAVANADYINSGTMTFSGMNVPGTYRLAITATDTIGFQGHDFMFYHLLTPMNTSIVTNDATPSLTTAGVAVTHTNGQPSLRVDFQSRTTTGSSTYTSMKVRKVNSQGNFVALIGEVTFDNTYITYPCAIIVDGGDPVSANFQSNNWIDIML